MALTVVAGLVPAAPAASSEASLVDDRAAIELVYYNHRTGTKPPFEQTLPAAQVEKLVALELKKEAVLKRVYGVEITDAMVEAEVRRINETTRAPDVLAELKSRWEMIRRALPARWRGRSWSNERCASASKMTTSCMPPNAEKWRRCGRAF